MDKGLTRVLIFNLYAFMEKKSIFIATLGEDQKFYGAYSSLEAAINGCQAFILSFSSEAWINFIDLPVNTEVKAVIDGTGVIQPLNEPAEWYEFNFEVRETVVLD